MAVRHGYGKISGTDALVFAYDTGDTRNSYKGEPTTNLTTDTPSQGGWDGTYQVLNSSTKAFRFIVSNFAANPGAGWRSFTWDLRAYTGQSVTISATVNVPAASPGTFAWILMGQGNTYTNNSGAGGYLGYSATSERVYKSSTVEEHITWSGIIGNSGTANQPSGHVGFTIWYNNGTPGINSYVEVSNVQIEIKSHATPFVNGTRSSTQGLVDLTGTRTIDLANVSFDANAQIVFDGTDDEINTGITTQLTDFSCEIVFKNNNSAAWGRLVDKAYTNGFFISSYFATYGVGYVGAGIIEPNPPHGQALPYDTSKYNHFVVTRSGTTHTIYLNGSTNSVSKTGSSAALGTSEMAIGAWYDSTNSQRYTGEIPVVKLYNRALTAAEVQNNFNNYKTRFDI